MFREKEADKTGKAGSKVLGNGAPNVMAVVVTEDDFAIISSSMRGPSILFDFARQTINPPSPDITKVYHTTKNPRGMCPAAVMEGLMMCEKESKVKTVGTMQHFFGGSCGEVMAAWAMCDVLGENHPTKARVIAVEKAQTTEQRVIRDPCGAEGETDVWIRISTSRKKAQLTCLQDWSPKGCTAFNRKFQWTAIPANTVRQPAGSLQNMKVYHATYNISPKKSARWFRE